MIMSANDRINGWLEKAVAVCIATSVSVTAGFQWQLYKSNEEVRSLLKQHDSRIIELDKEIIGLKMQVSELRAQMVGWDTLKRIELFLSSSDKKNPDSTLSSAIKMEIESRKARQ